MSAFGRLAAATLVAVLGAGALSACADDTTVAADRSAVLVDLADDVIAPAYVELDTAAAALVAATGALCDAPSDATLARARAAWADVARAWNRTRAFRFGPLTDTRSNALLSFMIDEDKVDETIARARSGAAPPFTVATLAAVGADVRGLGALELVLFDRNPTDPVTCSYALAAAELVAQTAHVVRRAWTEGESDALAYQQQLGHPGRGSYRKAQDAVEDLVNGESMAMTEITRTLAAAVSERPGTAAAAGSHDGRALQDALRSVRATYDGSDRPAGRRGVGALVAGVSGTADGRVDDALAEAEQALAELPDALDDAPRPTVRRAYRAARRLGTVIRAEVASELGVTLSLGDADGDS